MPRIPNEFDEIPNESEEEEQFEEDDIGEEEVEQPAEAPKPKGQIPAGLRAYQEKRRALAAQRYQAPQQQQQQQYQPRRQAQQFQNAQNAQPEAPKRRYGVIPAQPMRIVDVEGQEVVAEGDLINAQALADIIERLERIENAIGSMLNS